MNQPTDSQIFNHMRPVDDCCPKCKSDDVERIERDNYITQSCLACGFEPEPPEE